MKQFIVSKLECFAIRRKEWLFQIMSLGHEELVQIGLYEKAKQLCQEYNKGWLKELSVTMGRSKYKLHDEFEKDLMYSEEFYPEIQKIKSKIWKEMTSKYSLIEESGGGMYKDYTIIIQDNETGKFYQGECDNYGGQLTANYPITFTEVVPTTEPKVRYEIPNQG